MELRDDPSSQTTLPNDLLAERRAQYGAFGPQANIAQALKLTMRNTPNWQKLHPWQREALEMIVHKISRILNGSPDQADTWQDIAGYAALGQCPR